VLIHLIQFPLTLRKDKLTIVVDDIESIVGTCKVLAPCNGLKLLHFKVSTYGDHSDDPEYHRKWLARERPYIRKAAVKLPKSIQDINVTLDLMSRRRIKLHPTQVPAGVEERAYEVGADICVMKVILTIADYCVV
jgi:hypothetical protein